VLASRVANYQPAWLDELCLGGEVVWGRLSPPVCTSPEPSQGEADDRDHADLEPSDRAAADAPTKRRLAPSRATRISLTTRGDFGWLLAAGRRNTPADAPTALVGELVEHLDQRGARFHAELVEHFDQRPHEIETALWSAVGLGLVTADSFGAVRTLFANRKVRSARHSLGRRGLRRGAAGHERAEGRWAVLPAPMEIESQDELAEAVAEQLLARWGVVFRDLVQTETLAIPWREVLWAFRRLEARGLIRGGRFVNGFAGEQYATVDAIRALRETRKAKPGAKDEIVDVMAVDPCNVSGILLPGERVRSVGTATLRFRNGTLAEAVAPTAVPAVS